MSTGLKLTIDALIAAEDVQELTEDTSTSPTSYRVVPGVRDEVTDIPGLPAVVGQHVTGVAMTSLGGGDSSNLDRAYVQLDCLAATYDEAHELAAAVRATLALQPKVFYPVALPRDGYSDTTKTYVVSLDYNVWVRRT